VPLRVTKDTHRLRQVMRCLAVADDIVTSSGAEEEEDAEPW
jgi:hypothetical protein